MLNKTIKTVVPKLLKQEVSNKFGKLKSDLIHKTLPIDNSKQTKKYKTLTIKSQNSQKELKNQNHIQINNQEQIDQASDKTHEYLTFNS